MRVPTTHPASERLAASVKAYVEAVREAEEVGRVPPSAFPADAGVTATEVAVTVIEMLKAVDMDLFELQMWQSLGRG